MKPSSSPGRRVAPAPSDIVSVSRSVQVQEGPLPSLDTGSTVSAQATVPEDEQNL